MYPWLKSCSAIVLSETGGAGPFIERTLLQIYKDSPIYLVDSFTDTFYTSQRFRPSICYAFGEDQATNVLSGLKAKVDNLLEQMSNSGQTVYEGIPAYLFVDNFTLLARNCSDIFFLLVRARISGLHVICFDNPGLFIPDNFAFFASTVALPGIYPPKYRGYLPLRQIARMNYRECYIRDPNFQSGIYTLDDLAKF